MFLLKYLIQDIDNFFLRSRRFVYGLHIQNIVFVFIFNLILGKSKELMTVKNRELNIYECRQFNLFRY